MGRWKAKVVLLLMAYGGGVLTAIYWLAPLPEQDTFTEVDREAWQKATDRQRIVRTVNQGLHKCVNLGKEAVGRMSTSIRENWDQRTTPDDEES